MERNSPNAGNTSDKQATGMIVIAAWSSKRNWGAVLPTKPTARCNVQQTVTTATITGKPFSRRSRITSYNVCYTKLLRISCIRTRPPKGRPCSAWNHRQGRPHGLRPHDQTSRLWKRLLGYRLLTHKPTSYNFV